MCYVQQDLVSFTVSCLSMEGVYYEILSLLWT